MIMTRFTGVASKLIPSNLRPLAKRLYYRNRHPAHPSLKRFGTVQDLYYWVADGNLDTVLLLQNYFSAFFPSLDTETSGTVSLFDQNAVPLGSESFALGHCGSTKFRVSEMLGKYQNSSGDTFGSLEVNIAIPDAVLVDIQKQRALYFWDRFYIGYSNPKGQMCFVHGVDRTNIHHQGDSDPVNWYQMPMDHKWAPELPVDMDDYERFSVIMLNRTASPTEVTLTVSDSKDDSLSWSSEIPPKGVRRFLLSRDDIGQLVPTELRMSVEGMATQYGRPMVFKEFRNGSISAMHC